MNYINSGLSELFLVSATGGCWLWWELRPHKKFDDTSTFVICNVPRSCSIW